MPLFSDKFNPRLSKPRKATVNLIGRSSFGEESVDSLTEFKTLTIQLDDSLNLQFDGIKGEWKSNHSESEDYGVHDDDEDGDDDQGDHSSGDKVTVKKRSTISKENANSTAIAHHKAELTKLKKTNEILQEENRLLKLKVELLVDLVIEKGETTD